MGKRYFFSIVTAALAGIGLAACAIGGPANEVPPPGMAHVELGITSFSPKNITIRRGETVDWRNISAFGHTVTNNAGPPGGVPFDSGNIGGGQAYFHRFDVPGVYPYICRYHAADGMVGTITVTP